MIPHLRQAFDTVHTVPYDSILVSEGLAGGNSAGSEFFPLQRARNHRWDSFESRLCAPLFSTRIHGRWSVRVSSLPPLNRAAIGVEPAGLELPPDKGVRLVASVRPANTAGYMERSPSDLA
jgi:hypothetical protein